MKFESQQRIQITISKAIGGSSVAGNMMAGSRRALLTENILSHLTKIPLCLHVCTSAFAQSNDEHVMAHQEERN